ncbi:MAG: Cof-type HAD-IIB family hydrolase [Actinomycetota bacterium]|nr:Cof-type HAD-IIB family hydrolase [Actinomycetota bacterium]
MLPRIVASDLDGTLLRSDGSLSPRSARALAAVQAAGCRVVLCTARPVRWVRPIAEQAGVAGCAVCVNGAVIWDFAADAAVSEHAITAGVVLDVVTRVDDLFPGGAWGIEHADGFDHEPGYHPHWPVRPQTIVAPVRELLGVPPLKLLFRHDGHSPDEMLGPARAALRGVVELSHSNSREGLLEISAPGVDKGAGLARLCATLGVRPEQVIAFGDMPNDLALLGFAGRAVAVANAHPDVLAVADEVAPGHDDDGVAHVLERLLASRGVG